MEKLEPVMLPEVVQVPPLKVIEPARELKLDLACGQSPKEGFEGVDLWEGAKRRMDLLKFPWAIDDNSVDELNCSHFIEHIPAREIDYRDLAPCKVPGEEGVVTGISYKHPWQSRVGQDMLFAFFDECYRILKPEGLLTITCPSVRNERAFWDPTHRRFIAMVTFCYFSKEWRKMNKLDHYRISCDFVGNIGYTMTDDYVGRGSDVVQRAQRESWNFIVDYMVPLRAKK